MLELQLKKNPYHIKNRYSVVTCPSLHFLNLSLEVLGCSGLFLLVCVFFNQKTETFKIQCLKCFLSVE